MKHADGRRTRIWLFTALVSLLHKMTNYLCCIALPCIIYGPVVKAKEKALQNLAKLNYEQFRTQMDT